MSDIAKIGLYHNLFQGCLVIFLVCAGIAVVLFFVLDIRKVIGYLTGRTAKRQIEKLEEDNASSGRLRKKNHSSMQKVDKKMQQDMGVRGSVTPGARKVENVVQQASGESVLQTEREIQETALLNNGETETSLLESGNTEQMEEYSPKQGREEPNATSLLRDEKIQKRTFRIEREIMLIHAEEVI